MFITSDLQFSPLFLVGGDSDFYEYLVQGMSLLEFKPEVLDRIGRDQHQTAIKAKELRLADKVFCEEHFSHQELLFTPEGDVPPLPNNEVLFISHGRPRMSPKTLYVYFLAEQFLSGSTTKKLSRTFLAESETIHAFLANSDLKRPRRSTIHDNLRNMSDATRQFIFDSQIAQIAKSELDIFDEIYIDSTSIHANTEWPTDSGLILALVRKLHQQLARMHSSFGTSYSDKVIDRWVKEIKKTDFGINLSLGKKDSKKIRKKNYKRIYTLSDKAVVRLLKGFLSFRGEYNQYTVIPSLKIKIDKFMARFEEFITKLKSISAYSYERVFEGKSAPSKEKIASITDENASFIIKGGRDTVVGYKPQIGISENMFITSILIPEGNVSDSAMLLEVVQDAKRRTRVMPNVISVDDGYSSKDNYNALIEMGASVVSISGSKGKAVIDSIDKSLWHAPEQIRARSDRSKAESMMYSLKYLFDFGRLKARGIENVRREALGKAIGYNFHRMALLASNLEKEKLSA